MSPLLRRAYCLLIEPPACFELSLEVCGRDECGLLAEQVDPTSSEGPVGQVTAVNRRPSLEPVHNEPWRAYAEFGGEVHEEDGHVVWAVDEGERCKGDTLRLLVGEVEL